MSNSTPPKGGNRLSEANMLSKYRRSDKLAEHHCMNVIGAAVYAFCINRPLNRHVVIHWEKADLFNSPRESNSRLLKYAGDWMRYRTGEPLYYVWVLENPRRGDSRLGGMHAHILIHVTDQLWHDFRSELRGWLAECGASLKPGVLHAETFPSWSSYRFDVLRFVGEGLVGSLRYVLKGVNPAACDRFGIEPRNQGMIIAKRCGYSESLSPCRRKWTVITFPDRPKIHVAGSELRALHLIEYDFPEFAKCAFASGAKLCFLVSDRAVGRAEPPETA
jgi:hypothetical protein